MSSLNDLITRNYSNFRGVDFSNNEVISSRSPLAVNMWKNYKDSECIETRPGMTLLNDFGNNILGLFFLKLNNTIHCLVHVGTKLYKWTNYPTIPAETTELYTGMNSAEESKGFVFNDVLFIVDGINYLEYNGTTISSVEGTIPTTTYWRDPDGGTDLDDGTDTDKIYQEENCLTSLRRNTFIGDGSSLDYHLNATGLDSATIYLMTATVDDVPMEENVDFSVNRTTGVVTFYTKPDKDSKVIITFSKTTAGLKNRILNCTLMCEFDNRIFFAGNPDYPNAIFYCELNDPRYVRKNGFIECGIDKAIFKTIIPGNGILWAIKEINQNMSSLYYLTPTIENGIKKYSSINGSVSLGCVSKGINFNDDIVYFSKKGLEGISSSSMYSEQILQHRSSLVDGKMVYETGYNDVKLAEYNGYLMCLINGKIYLADSRQKFQNGTNNIEYEWYYWELPNNITFIKEYRGDLFLGNESGKLYKLEGTTDNGTDISSVWTTAKDNFGYMGYTKTTNKRGNVVNVKKLDNDSIHIDTIVDGTLKEKKVFDDSKGYIPFRIKDKKFKEIQLKFSSNKPFGLFSCTMQGFVAGYIKR